MEKFIDEPLKMYDSQIKDEFTKNLQEFFDELVKKSGIDIERNQETCKEYYQTCKNVASVQKCIKKINIFRTFLRICAIISAIISINLTHKTDMKNWGVVIAAIILIGFIVIIRRTVAPALKDNLNLEKMHEETASQLKQDACKQLQPLLELFEHSIPTKIINQTIPIIEMDEYFNIERHWELIENYGLLESLEENCSIKSVASGKIKGNPFVLFTYLMQEMISETYYGSLDIHWTTRERNYNGKWEIVHHSQTLTAETVHPCPAYYNKVSLAYGNDAAPDLTFSRSPSKIQNLNDKEIEKMINKEAKKLEKKAKKELETGFTMMTNTEFDVLFGATDRNNETQFRLLFTPLAQKNEVATIRDKKYFGDDFSFEKNKKLNIITSDHSCEFDFTGNPDNYCDIFSFDLENISIRFFEYIESYFKNIYFDLVPLLNIPLYQLTKSHDYIYRKNQEITRNYSCFEAEVLANAFKTNIFKHPDTKTETILKTKFKTTKDNNDILDVIGYSFDTIERIEYVSVRGDDNKYHEVPVIWDEYIPLSKETAVEIGKSNEIFDNADVDQRGLKARAL